MNLNNGHFQTFSSPVKINFGSDAVIEVNGTDNIISAPGGAFLPSQFTLQLNVKPNSSLELAGGTDIIARSNGYLTLESGSKLRISDSELLLTRKDSSGPQSTINGATLEIVGDFGNRPAILYLSDPQFSDSTIILGAEARFSSGIYLNDTDLSSAGFFFSGNNTIKMGTGAQLGGAGGDGEATVLNFINGLTTIAGPSSGFDPNVRTRSIELNNATLLYSNVDIASDLWALRIQNESTLNSLTEGDNFRKLNFLVVEDSTLFGAGFYSEDAVLTARFSNATLKIDDPDITSSTTFYLNGFSPEIQSTVNFSGSNNTIVSRIDPAGKEVFPGTGISNYSDSIYFERFTSFTDNAFSVVGLANVTIQLEAFTPGLTAQDYATGGSNRDGIYHILHFTKENLATTVATADSDEVAVRLASSMPALLTVTQVANPSADNKVSYKLMVSANNLATHPAVTTSNEKAGANLLVNVSNNGSSGSSGNNGSNGNTLNGLLVNTIDTITNAEFTSHIDSFHAEPYSSYMTVSLEHVDMVMNTVLSNLSPNGRVTAGYSKGVEQEQTHRRSWVGTSYVDGKINGTKSLGGFDYSMTSFTLGQDLLVTSGHKLGGYFSYGSQQMNEHDIITQHIEGSTYHFGVYLHNTNAANWDLKGVLGYAYVDHSSIRQVTLGKLTEAPEAHYDSHGVYVAMATSTVLYEGGWGTLSPELGFNYTYLNHEAFQETGGSALSLAVDSAQAQSIVAAVGLNAKFGNLIDRANLYLQAFVRYEHDFFANSNNEHNVDAALASHPAFKQTFIGLNRGENAMVVGLGLGSDLTSELQVSGGVVFSETTHGSEWGAGFNILLSW